MTSNLNFYSGTPFTTNNQVDLIDFYTADGVSATFTLVNKGVSRLGSTIQAGGTEYFQDNGGFTTNSGAGTFTLASTPVVGTQIVAPGVNQATVNAFDQDNVVGVASPRVQSIPLWIVDTSTINNYKYVNKNLIVIINI